MKYMITWSERPQGSPIEYENAQKRILDVFTQWKAPANFKIELFVIRVGDWGGYMMLDCDDPLAVHKFCSMLPAFEFEARPVVPVMDAVRVELEAHVTFERFTSHSRSLQRCIHNEIERRRVA
jgi:muconolactone delta-isomerase